MKIFVTGAAGYLGSIMVPRLLQAGHDVVAVDNFMYHQTSLLECCNHAGFEMVRGDARILTSSAADWPRRTPFFPWRA